jgi:hypothetical protein
MVDDARGVRTEISPEFDEVTERHMRRAIR